MMFQLGIKMDVVCSRQEILAALIKNREQHTRLVKEARIGYVDRAKRELEKRLNALKEGRIVALTFGLTTPRDYTTVYDTAIAMLQAHKEETIKLSASEFRQLVQDEWDWTRDFIGTNSAYSAGTRQYGIEKSVIDDESVDAAQS